MSIKNIILITILCFLFIGGAYFLVAGGNKPEVKIIAYSASDKEKPVLEVKETLIDMGKMKVSDEKEAIFIIKNIGTKPLQLYNITSSCSCTFGQLIYDDKTSKEFGMHSVSDYLSDIAPNTEAKVKVIYRPSIMPVYGPVERELYISTNDPNKTKLVLQVKTIVQ